MTHSHWPTNKRLFSDRYCNFYQSISDQRINGPTAVGRPTGKYILYRDALDPSKKMDSHPHLNRTLSLDSQRLFGLAKFSVLTLSPKLNHAFKKRLLSTNLAFLGWKRIQADISGRLFKNKERWFLPPNTELQVLLCILSVDFKKKTLLLFSPTVTQK